ncbi:MAG: hypothetical protein AAB322_04945 [Pseudomonadota bacterium]
MITLSAAGSARSEILASLIMQVLTPTQLTMVTELVSAEKPGRPQPEDLLHWMRLNMPTAAEKIEAILYPAD